MSDTEDLPLEEEVAVVPTEAVEPDEPDEEEGLEVEADDEGEETPRRGANHFAKLRDENRTLKAEIEAIKTQFQTFQTPQQPRISPEEANRQEQERLSLMTSEERAEYQINKARTELNNQLQMTRLEMNDWKDKTSFEAKCSVNSTFASVADEVEKALATARNQGQNYPREALAYLLIGKKVTEKAGKAAAKQKAAAKAGVRRETVSAPVGRGSDVGASRQRSGKSARERLEGISF